MSDTNYTPDAPFRSGATGKYKLLIKSVTSKFGGHEYELLDADGKEYKANSQDLYMEGQLLRCMVSFDVVNARLVVTGTALCKKQDLATLVPNVRKTSPSKIESPKNPKQPIGTKDKPIPGVPRSVRTPNVSGYTKEQRPSTVNKNGSRSRISMFSPSPDIAKALFNMYGSLGNIQSHEDAIRRELGSSKYRKVQEYLWELSEKQFRSVVSTQPDQAAKQPPIIMVLKVIQLTEFGGAPCFKVKYGPDNHDPYDWFVPTQGIPNPERDEIRCVFHDHTMKLDPIWVCELCFEVGKHYTFTVDSCYKTQKGLMAKLQDEYGNYHMAKIGQVVKTGTKIEYRVRSLNRDSSPLDCLGLAQYSNPIQETSTARVSSLESSSEETPKRVVEVGRRQMEIFDTMKELGYHKYGNEFVCSCCHQRYGANQGIKCDTKELYLCNQCRAGQRKKERTSNSLHAISIPMGNKR